jgi:hypothetical protein
MIIDFYCDDPLVPWIVSYILEDGRVWWTAMFSGSSMGIPMPPELPRMPHRIEIRSGLLNKIEITSVTEEAK